MAANVPGKTRENDPSISAPCTHGGDPEGILGSWLQDGPDSAAAVISGLNQCIED